jgi:N-acetylglucosamine-6-phosphate deacetylase
MSHPSQDSQHHGVTALCNANILKPQGIERGQTLQMKDGKIYSIGDPLPASHILRDDDVNLIHLNDEFLLTPGLIDLQINGAFGVDFSNGSIPQMQQVLDTLPQYGITGILPTLVSAPLMDMVTASNALEELLHFNTRANGAEVLGIHYEGPFLNTAKRGTHPAEHIQKPDASLLDMLLSPHAKLMTYAPECDTDYAFLEALVERKIIPFMGHTVANKSEIEAAKHHGLIGATHLYNAMEGFTHRTPGTALHLLNEDSLYASFIADGFHIHPDMIELAINMKSIDKLLLVSDAMNLAGLRDGAKAYFAGTKVENKSGRAVNTEGNLAGGTQLLPDMIRNLLKWDLCTVAEAFALCTRNPATVLGIEGERGCLVKGAIADVVLWHQPTMKVLATWVRGQLKWCDPALLRPSTGSVKELNVDHLKSIGDIVGVPHDVQSTKMNQAHITL